MVTAVVYVVTIVPNPKLPLSAVFETLMDGYLVKLETFVLIEMILGSSTIGVGFIYCFLGLKDGEVFDIIFLSRLPFALFSLV